MIYLTVNEVAELKGCSGQHIRAKALNGEYKTEKEKIGNGQTRYLIPITELKPHEQLKYYKQHRIPVPDELLPKKREVAHKGLDEFTTDQREEIAYWIRTIRNWKEFCVNSKLQKVAATEKFVEAQKVVNPDVKISKTILYRKAKALKLNLLVKQVLDLLQSMKCITKYAKE